MKHLSIYTLFMAVVFLLLSSCGSLSMDKRRYSSGYTVHSSHLKSFRQLDKKDNAIAEKEALASRAKTETIEQITEEISTPDFDLAVNSDKMEGLNLNSTQEMSSLKMTVKKSPSQNIQKKTKQPKGITSLKSTVKQEAKSIANASSSSEDGLSLLGLLVLVVLIIYLLAYFSGGWGLGGAVHLILLVALVLLVLWLLGII